HLFVADLHGFFKFDIADDFYAVYQNRQLLGETDSTNVALEIQKTLPSWWWSRFSQEEFSLPKAYVDKYWKKINIDTEKGPVKIVCTKCQGGHWYVCVFGDLFTTNKGEYRGVGVCKFATCAGKNYFYIFFK
ncbi:MAG: hypothetical protein J7L14_00970, partial [Candidatus Diapherotrites archaeon]|nr:hypothetical protein [Candidatus Diapherotrites archaeon]